MGGARRDSRKMHEGVWCRSAKHTKTHRLRIYLNKGDSLQFSQRKVQSNSRVCQPSGRVHLLKKKSNKGSSLSILHDYNCLLLNCFECLTTERNGF